MFKRISLSEALDLLDPLALMKARQESKKLNALAEEYERRAKAEMAKARRVYTNDNHDIHKQP